MAQPHNSDGPTSLEVQTLQRENYFLDSQNSALRAHNIFVLEQNRQLSNEIDQLNETIRGLRDANRSVHDLLYESSCECGELKHKLDLIKDKARDCVDFDSSNLEACKGEPRAQELSFTTLNYWLDRKALSEKWLYFINSLDEQT